MSAVSYSVTPPTSDANFWCARAWSPPFTINAIGGAFDGTQSITVSGSGRIDCFQVGTGNPGPGLNQITGLQEGFANVIMTRRQGLLTYTPPAGATSFLLSVWRLVPWNSPLTFTNSWGAADVPLMPYRPSCDYFSGLHPIGVDPTVPQVSPLDFG